MTPTRPYFLRALYEWILDNDCTPYLAVNALYSGVEVPADYIEDGEVTLNLAVTAVLGLKIENNAVSFKAKFNGIEHFVYVPMGAVLGLYAKENGQGMLFPDEPGFDFSEDEESPDDLPPEPTPPKKISRQHLKVVK
ncbi:MAG: ClpXP protease specificity-enhancing factor [Cellvibrionales bacterium]|nr:ClpXP protease specificity-enhancing factor [Cellvibrionales bacterium]